MAVKKVEDVARAEALSIKSLKDVPEELAARIFKDIPTEGFSPKSIEHMKRIRLKKYLDNVRLCRKMSVASAKSRAKEKKVNDAKKEAEKKIAQKEKERLKKEEKKAKEKEERELNRKPRKLTEAHKQKMRAGFRAWLRRTAAERKKKHREAVKRRKEYWHKRWIKIKGERRKFRAEQRKKEGKRVLPRTHYGKVVRPRKPGRKRKYRKKRIPKLANRYKLPPLYKDYRVALFSGNKFMQWESMLIRTYGLAVDLIKNLNDKKNVEYKKEVMSMHHKIIPAKFEYVILQKRTGLEETLVANEFGKNVPHRLILDPNDPDKRDWVIRDKFPTSVEEDFYVYGYNPKKDRKTFRWIQENIVYKACEDEYSICRVFKYRSKVIVRKDDNSFEMILCKHITEAVRLYNKIIDTANKEKHKRVIGCGTLDKIGERRRALEAEIMELTGWSRQKISREVI